MSLGTFVIESARPRPLLSTDASGVRRAATGRVLEAVVADVLRSATVAVWQLETERLPVLTERGHRSPACNTFAIIFDGRIIPSTTN